MKRIKRTAREKLVEKDIKWEQVYTDKTSYLKEQYNDVIGVGSYFRFEGEASDGDNYYCILGPAKIHKPRAKWFAGVRKLPATYSAGGKYFDSMDTAARYAKETWGVPTPKELKPYTSAQLFGISEKIDKWKAEREENEENKEENEAILKNKESYNWSRFVKCFNLAKFNKEAMGTVRQENRPIYSWFDVNNLSMENNSQWAALVRSAPSLSSVLREGQRMHNSNKSKIINRYGLTDNQVDQCLKTYVGYDVNFGGYILSVGPYLGKQLRDSWDKFAFYVLRKGHANEDEMQQAVDKQMSNYATNFGVQLEPADFKFVGKLLESEPEEGRERGSHSSRYEFTMNPEDPNYRNFFAQNRMTGAGSGYELSNSGLVKLMRNNWGTLYDQAVNEVASGRGISQEEAEAVVVNDTDFIKRIYSAIKDKYQQAVQTGAAAIEGMPPPPVNFSKFKMVAKAGAQQPTTIQGKQRALLNKFQLNDQVLRLMVSGITDPQTIMEEINSSKKESKRVPINVIQSIMQDYSDRVGDENKEISEVYADFRENIVSLEAQVGGMTDLKTAFDAAKAALGHDVFTLDDNFPNVTEDDIKEIRLQYEAAKQAGEPWPPEGGIIPEVEVGEAKEIEEELEVEVGEAKGVEEEIEEELEMQVGEGAKPVQTPATTPPFNLEEEEEILPRQVPRHMQNLFGNTLDSLHKIAEDLNKDGKDEAVEEINKIIKKYQKGI